MRWMLTGDEFDATEAHRIGLIQEIADDHVDRARGIARTIAEKAAPLGVSTVLASAHRARRLGDDAAITQLGPMSPACSVLPMVPKECDPSSNGATPSSPATDPALVVDVVVPTFAVGIATGVLPAGPRLQRGEGEPTRPLRARWAAADRTGSHTIATAARLISPARTSPTQWIR